jgi:hypothetical protein
MTKHCINHGRVTYDACRHCLGKDIECPEYLESKVNHCLPTKPKGNLSYKQDIVPYGNNSSSITDSDKKADTYTLPIKELNANHKVSFLHKWAENYDNRFYRKRIIERSENEH